jgi:lipopolysaccharide export system protein LptA
MKRQCLGAWVAFLVCAVGLTAQPIQLVRSKKTTLGLASGIHVLVGNVVVKQGSATIACDSLWWNTRSQLVLAYGRVKYRRGSDMEVTSNQLRYDQVFADFSGDVRAKQGESRIRTEKLQVSIADGSARWTSGAEVALKEGTLTCKTGTLQSKTGVHRFEKSVVFQQKSALLRTENLEYQERTQLARMRGQSQLDRDSTRLVFGAGWWNASSEEGLFWDNPVATQPKSIIQGDTLALFSQTDQWSARGKAHFFTWQNQDSLALHAARLDAFSDRWKAGPQAQFWTPDLQASSDSMVYHRTDSNLVFLRKNRPPVAFSGAYQIQSDTLFMAWRANRSDSLYMGGNPLISGWNDSNQVDQMTGKKAHGFFQNTGLERVILRKNAQAYYHTWDNNSYLGINKITGPNLILSFDKSVLTGVEIDGNATGELSPTDAAKDPPLLPGYSDRRSECLSRTEAISGRK